MLTVYRMGVRETVGRFPVRPTQYLGRVCGFCCRRAMENTKIIVRMFTPFFFYVKGNTYFRNGCAHARLDDFHATVISKRQAILVSYLRRLLYPVDMFEKKQMSVQRAMHGAAQFSLPFYRCVGRLFASIASKCLRFFSNLIFGFSKGTPESNTHIFCDSYYTVT